MEINRQKAATDAIDIVKQVLATKQFEQRFRQEIERQRRERQRRAEPEISDNPTKDQRQLQCLEIGNSTNFRDQGATVISIFNVGGHELMRNLANQVTKHRCHWTYMRTLCIIPHTPSSAIRALLRKIDKNRHQLYRISIQR